MLAIKFRDSVLGFSQKLVKHYKCRSRRFRTNIMLTNKTGRYTDKSTGKKTGKKKKLPMATVILIDILIAGLVLLVFAWFHHAGSYVIAKYESRNSVETLSGAPKAKVWHSIGYPTAGENPTAEIVF